MKWASGIVATCSTSYGANQGTFFRVVGSKGMIHAEPAWGYAGLRLTARIQGEPPIDTPNPEPHPAQFVREADHFSECILHNKDPKTPGEEGKGLRDMKLIAAIYRSCGGRIFNAGTQNDRLPRPSGIQQPDSPADRDHVFEESDWKIFSASGLYQASPELIAA